MSKSRTLSTTVESVRDFLFLNLFHLTSVYYPKTTTIVSGYFLSEFFMGGGGCIFFVFVLFNLLYNKNTPTFLGMLE